ncbi:ribosomal protein S18-alanine N-acetyltransferase [Hyphomonas sp.]|uniref:ribosomal protein S18-alanine N-acetyltransferase n=1 Tax=Hyphomonas sp. TaxID=87 RepID=UPI000C4BBA96|nr:ribosomal protein S18-alanine N-acetyltransferase [Hyphomonas sp.]MAB11862.1 ribosomal-protein-alanine N-acetyltransferase [Hyphomonas sp.]MAU67260.1 ribosomal-protein-alanine N-acetyltransferase [Hyphomonas sp.]
MTHPVLVLRADDAGRMSQLHMRCFDDPWSAMSFRGLLLDTSVLTLGVELGGDLVAFVMAQTIAGESDILTVATDPDQRRQGLATTLIGALINRLGERGVSRITLDVAEDNAAARALYRSFGFTEDGRRPRYYTTGRDVPVDAVLMSRNMGL